MSPRINLKNQSGNRVYDKSIINGQMDVKSLWLFFSPQDYFKKQSNKIFDLVILNIEFKKNGFQFGYSNPIG